MERINIHYFGSEISKEDKAQIKADVSYSMGDAPSDASVCCCLSSEAEGYACNLKVHSAKGHVHIHRESRDLKKLMKMIYKSLSLSMQQWHKDPDHFAKSHPLAQTPCRSASHKILECPLDSHSSLEKNL